MDIYGTFRAAQGIELWAAVVGAAVDSNGLIHSFILYITLYGGTCA